MSQADAAKGLRDEQSDPNKTRLDEHCCPDGSRSGPVWEPMTCARRGRGGRRRAFHVVDVIRGSPAASGGTCGGRSVFDAEVFSEREDHSDVADVVGGGGFVVVVEAVGPEVLVVAVEGCVGAVERFEL